MRLIDRKSTRLNSSHLVISYAVFCLKKQEINHGHSRIPVYAASMANDVGVAHAKELLRDGALRGDLRKITTLMFFFFFTTERQHVGYSLHPLHELQVP